MKMLLTAADANDNQYFAILYKLLKLSKINQIWKEIMKNLGKIMMMIGWCKQMNTGEQQQKFKLSILWLSRTTLHVLLRSHD